MSRFGFGLLQLLLSKVEAVRQTRYFQKRITKENAKLKRRELLRFTLQHPLLVLDLLAGQVV